METKFLSPPAEVLPHNLDAECELLGALLVDPSLYPDVQGWLQPQHFIEPVHHNIFLAYEQFAQDGDEPIIPRIESYLEDDENFGDMKPGYLRLLASTMTHVLPIAEYGRLLVELAHRRELIALGEKLCTEAKTMSLDQTVVATMQVAEAELYDLLSRPDGRRRGRQPLSVALDEAVEQATLARDRKGLIGYSTGLVDLDTCLGGLRPGLMYALGARPGMGKSAFAVHLARGVAGQGAGGMVFSLELTRGEIGARLLSAEASTPEQPVEYFQLLPPGDTLWAEEIEQRIHQCHQSLQQLPIEIDDEQSRTMADIRAGCRRYRDLLAREGKELGLVVIDHLTLVRDSGRYRDNRVQQVGEISREIKGLAKDIQAPVVVCVQLNRALEQRDDKRPSLQDFRWSGDIEQDADVAAFLYRGEHILEREKARSRDDVAEAEFQDKLHQVENKVEIIVAKQRQGPARTVHARCNIRTGEFQNLEVL